MDDNNVPIFSQAKLEYTKQLVDVLYMNMYDGIRSIYDDAKIVHVKKRKPITESFRILLEQVPKWNSDIIEAETDRIEKTSKCDWLDDLLTAVFISHTRILMSIGSNQNFNRINVTIPKTTTFIHKTYINIAREVWKNPYLFDENVLGHEYQRNMKQLEDMIKMTIEDTIRRQLPIKEILKEHLENYDEPKQPTQQLDMKALVEELRKAGLQSAPSSPKQENEEEVAEGDTEETVEGDDGKDYDEKVDDEDLDEQEGTVDSTHNVKLPPMFNREDSESDESEKPSDNTPELDIDNDNDNDNDNETGGDENIYHDPDDPDEDQIKKATENIVLNDITEPVVEQVYDNTDIVSPTKKDSTDTNKLNEMIKELDMGTSGISKKKEVQTSVIKIDPFSDIEPIKNDTAPIVKKIDEPAVSEVVSIEQVPTPEPESSKSNDTISPFSFDNIYSGITGKGKVEDINEPSPEKKESTEMKETEMKETEPLNKTKDTIVIKEDTNADVMKEIISLDKQQEEIDETQTLDNFFTDIQKIANPSMEPIKEESKYTLFEDASEKE